MSATRHAVHVVWVLASSGVSTQACTSSDRPADAVRAFLDGEARPPLRVEGRFFERGGPGVVRYAGLAVEPERVSPGGTVMFRHHLVVETSFASRAQVFVHLEAPEGDRWAVDDHPPVEGRVPFTAMRAGEQWLDVHRMVVPARGDAGTLNVLFGLFSGDVRMSLEAAPSLNDGHDRLLVARLPVAAAPADDLPMVTVRRARGPITADGRLDEAAWGSAEVILLSDSLGRDVPTRYPTRLRLLYDDRFLYVGFEADDRDISERYAQRDDPIYEHETVELFLMPGVAAPALGPYVELQASPTGVIFDASFDGPRLGMRTSFDARQTVGTSRSGTLNDDRPDQGWVSEWSVPFDALPGAGGAPAPGAEWRMNAFRIEKFHEGTELQGEYTAWSPPRVGDFHAVRRFGRMRFESP